MAPRLREYGIPWNGIYGMREKSHAPPPPLGAGLAQGGMVDDQNERSRGWIDKVPSFFCYYGGRYPRTPFSDGCRCPEGRPAAAL